MANAINWFEIPVTDLNRARKFYESTFATELKLVNFPKMEMAFFPSGKDDGSSIGSLIKADSYIPSHSGTMVYFSVEDIEKTLTTVESNGGKVLNPKMSIGEFGFVGHFEDTEGNRVALHSRQ